MIFAQAVAEYGAIASMVAGAQQAAANTLTWVEAHATTPSTWMTIGAIVVAVLAIARFRGSRL